MSKERRNISQRKIRRIQRTTEEPSFRLESEIGLKISGLKPNTKLYYTKVIFGIFTGLFAGIGFAFLGIPPNIWLLIMIGGVIICVIFVRKILQISADEIDQKRVWLSGTFTFIILFIVVSSLVWMIRGPQF